MMARELVGAIAAAAMHHAGDPEEAEKVVRITAEPGFHAGAIVNAVLG